MNGEKNIGGEEYPRDAIEEEKQIDFCVSPNNMCDSVKRQMRIFLR